MHKEADVIALHQVVYLASLGCCSIKTISDDACLCIVSPLIYQEKVDIRLFSCNPQVKDAHQLTLLLLLPNTELLLHSCSQLMHCLGVTLLHPMVQAKQCEGSQDQNRLYHLENPSANLEDILCESTAFAATCFCQNMQLVKT